MAHAHIEAWPVAPASNSGVPDGLSGRMGPNAVTRLAQAVRLRAGPQACRDLFASAGLLRHLTDPPTQMVEEGDVAALHRDLVAALGPQAAAEVSRLAGRLTGDYLLANRIPRLAQAVLRRLPRRVAAAILVRAIARHAWTFAGSGSFSYAFDRTGGAPLALVLAGGPVCRLLQAREPACHYYAATFERVFAAMLGPQVRVVETHCEAKGDPSCRFEVRW